MDYEKKYNEALNKAKHALDCDKEGLVSTDRVLLESIFPELSESEDEKIRKELIDFVKSSIAGFHQCDRYLAWLEKQGEKPQGKSALEAINEEKVDNANKVEPKFKKGKWIVWQNKCYKVNYNACGYELIDQNGLSTSLEYGTVDSGAHFWTIQDAKDGDVLSNCHIICIFKRIDEYNNIATYCIYNINEGFVLFDTETIGSYQLKPATKEESDLLFQKMREAGFEWDANKKELKKIEQKSAEWSEEDEGMRQLLIKIMEVEHPNGIFSTGTSLIQYLGCDVVSVNKVISWLKSIKDRVIPQPKQEWNEEDGEMIDETLYFIREYQQSNRCKDENGMQNSVTCEKWLKSLRPQKQ